MKRLIFIALGLSLLLQVTPVRADEGMWLPMLVEKLNIGTMTKMGLKLSAEDIYSINQACLKDAIVALDHGSCTAEVVSNEGLLLTNHHCGYGEIQAHSSVEHDYLTDGFWAMSKDKELVNPGKTASFLIRAEDVTSRIESVLNDNMKEGKRLTLVDSMSKVIAKEAMKGTKYRANVQSMLKGNQYVLFVYEDFADVRLVGAPPESIGKFGSDADNWMWPRHTGDFSIFRVYTAPDGSPAKYSKDNVPLKPKAHLTISLNGEKPGDFAMIMGYPGRTQRYLTSWGVSNLMKYTNDYRAKIRGIKQDIWKKAMDKSDKVRIQYATKFAHSANYWKYSIGQNRGLKNLDVIAEKQKIENNLTQWINAEQSRKDKFGNALDLIKTYQENTGQLQGVANAIYEALIGGTEAFYFSYRAAAGLHKQLKNNPDSAKLIQKYIKRSQAFSNNFYKDYEPNLDKKVMVAMLKTYMDMVPAKYYPEFMKKLESTKKIEKWVDKAFKKSIFVNKDELADFYADPKLKTLDKDPIFTSGMQIIKLIRAVYKDLDGQRLKYTRGQRLFVKALMEMNPNKHYSPDANSTMRLTYGKVGGYDPRDGVHYKYYTTLDGLIAKENPKVREFNVSPRLKELYKKKDFGRYADKNGVLRVGFLTNNDITGGNSGSPVMNNKGQLIGLAFDGNWEAMSGDVAFEPNLQRTICVDIRFVLFVIDKYAGATNLINEMTIVKD